VFNLTIYAFISRIRSKELISDFGVKKEAKAPREKLTKKFNWTL
jgi:hypothetical protein